MEKLNLDHLPLQKALVESAYNAFVNEENVIAAVLLGSLSSGKETEYRMRMLLFSPKTISIKMLSLVLLSLKLIERSSIA